MGSIEQEEVASVEQAKHFKKSTFITGADSGNQIKFDPSEDIILINRWKAH